jgi:hypothetical protein
MPKLSDGRRHLPQNVIRVVLRTGRRRGPRAFDRLKFLEPAGNVHGEASKLKTWYCVSR